MLNLNLNMGNMMSILFSYNILIMLLSFKLPFKFLLLFNNSIKYNFRRTCLIC